MANPPESILRVDDSSKMFCSATVTTTRRTILIAHQQIKRLALTLALSTVRAIFVLPVLICIYMPTSSRDRLAALAAITLRAGRLRPHSMISDHTNHLVHQFLDWPLGNLLAVVR